MKLGDKVQDRVSGFIGIAVAKHSYLNGCDRYSVQPFIDKDGKLPGTETFDEPQLIVLETEVVPQGSTITGGPEKYSDIRKY